MFILNGYFLNVNKQLATDSATLTEGGTLVRCPLLAVLAALAATAHVLPRELAEACLGVGTSAAHVTLPTLTVQSDHAPAHRLLPPDLAHRLEGQGRECRGNDVNVEEMT